MSTKRGFGDEDWLTKLEEQMSGKDLARQLSATSNVIDGMNRQQQLMDQITGAQRDALSGAAVASRLVSPDYLKQVDALGPLREREQQLRNQISGIAGTQTRTLSGVYGAERLTNLAAREMDHHSSLFTREAERISRMVSDAGHAFREHAERLANSYQDRFHAITGLNEQALRAVTTQPDWFNGAHEAAGMSVASIARNLSPDITGIFSARTLAYQLTQRSQESMLASLLKGIDPLQHASKTLELSTAHLRDLNLSAAHEQVRAFVESSAYVHMRNTTAMIAEAMAGGDEARARSAWQSAAEDDVFSEVWQQVQATFYNLLRQIPPRLRRKKRDKSRKSAIAWLNENPGVLALLGVIVAIFGVIRDIDESLARPKFPAASAPNTATGQSVELAYFRVTSDDVHLREGPSTRQPVVTTVTRGNVVQRLGACKTWSLVALHTGRNDGKPISGWIKSDYLKQLEKGVDPSTVSKPVVVDGCDE